MKGSIGGVRSIAEKVVSQVVNRGKCLLAWLRFVETRTVGAVRARALGCREFF